MGLPVFSNPLVTRQKELKLRGKGVAGDSGVIKMGEVLRRVRVGGHNLLQCILFLQTTPYKCTGDLENAGVMRKGLVLRAWLAWGFYKEWGQKSIRWWGDAEVEGIQSWADRIEGFGVISLLSHFRDKVMLTLCNRGKKKTFIPQTWIVFAVTWRSTGHHSFSKFQMSF